MMNVDFHKAIRDLYDNVSVVEGDTIDNIRAWDTDGNEITLDKTQVNAWVNPEQYKIDRQYPSIQEQLDMQYWDSVNGTTVWADTIAQVKADNPKPE